MKLCGFEAGLDRPFFLIAGPCVIESMQLQLDTAGTLKEITTALGVPFMLPVFFYAMLRSTFLTLRQGGVRWRDTFYPLAQLRAHGVR